MAQASQGDGMVGIKPLQSYHKLPKVTAQASQGDGMVGIKPLQS